MRDAVAIVIKKDDKFLLIKRAKKGEAEDYWCPITGAVEPGESQEQAVVREAREELGIVVEPIKKVWECYTDNKDYSLHWWQTHLVEENINVNPDEVKDYYWARIEEMQNLGKMFDADMHFFQTIGRTLPNISV